MARVEWARSCANEEDWERYLQRYLCEKAAKREDVEVLKWLRAVGYSCAEWTCAYAAKRGQLVMLKWLRAERCPCDKCACTLAEPSGHWDVLKWLLAAGWL